MSLSFKVARKYFGNYMLPNKTGSRGINSIQILTLISILTAIIVTAASIIVLSVFNGLTFLLGDINQVFYPDIKVEPIEGKVVAAPQELINELNSINGILEVAPVLEERGFAEFRGKQMMVSIKGVDSTYLKVSDINSGMFRGQFRLKDRGVNLGVIGLGISNELNVLLRDPTEQLTLFVPQRIQRFTIGPPAQLGRMPLRVAGEFAIQKEFDDQYVFVPLESLRPLLQYKNQVSYFEIKLEEGAKYRNVRSQILGILGDNFTVKNRVQQNESWYKLMQFEKWMSFAILVLIMLIASFNLLSSLTMMVLDKKKDIGILKSMGMTHNALASVFRWQGIMIGLAGATIGAVIAISFVLLQNKFGFIPLKGNFVVDSYPIKLQWTDVFVSVGSVVLISYLASILPSFRAKHLSVSEAL